MSSAARWKRQERDVAKLLDGRRLPNNGSRQPDVLAATPAGSLAVQVKTRKTVPSWLLAAVAQAERDAAPLGAIPLTVICWPVVGVGTERLAVLRLEDLATLIGTAATRAAGAQGQTP